MLFDNLINWQNKRLMIKNPMPRQARLDYPGCYHPVMGRGIDNLKIFYKETDKQDFLSHLERNTRRIKYANTCMVY